MYRKYRKLVSAGLVLTMAGAMTLQGCGQKEKTGKTEIELVQPARAYHLDRARVAYRVRKAQKPGPFPL